MTGNQPTEVENWAVRSRCMTRLTQQRRTDSMAELLNIPGGISKPALRRINLPRKVRKIFKITNREKGCVIRRPSNKSSSTRIIVTRIKSTRIIPTRITTTIVGSKGIRISSPPITRRPITRRTERWKTRPITMSKVASMIRDRITVNGIGTAVEAGP
jgi:hypothetical protein